MEEKTNVAIVGCGIIAQIHLQALKKLGSLKVVAVCDTDKKKAMATSKRWKIDHCYTDFSKMLSDESISILSVLTPPSSHAFLAIEAIRRKINVIVEKPLTMATKEAAAIIDALKGGNAKLSTVYHFLFTDAMLESLALIRKQEIGEILNVSMTMAQPTKLDPMASDPNHWSHKLLGGRFGEMLPHPVYVAQSILGDDLSTKRVCVSKRGSSSWMTSDELHVILENDEGIGSLYLSLNAPRMSYICDVYGTRKILRIDLGRQMLLQFGPMPFSNFAVAKDCLSEAAKLSLLTMKNALHYSFRKPGEQVARFYRMFSDSISNNIEPLVTPEMAYHTVRIVEEICQDVEAGKKRVEGA